ncbi:CerR family C-terminal domain-containing protein [Brachymonas sp. G13]|uniref:TetR/AcrR family transcriptional regulator n=1 Tax=Brachymonas TaxID=28219 RepID=UPI002E787462|nr:CerR family C-terminal domain-containing protein [Brachymonas sp. J145]MEE1652681.1 CerR family C-terminal domain-containing protein [Brachymonas sp. J145]
MQPEHPAAMASPQRADSQQSRERLLQTALRLFAEQGFSKTSTRAIAQAAGVNISAISYYFGDKQGLYRSAFLEPMVLLGEGPQTQAAVLDPALTLQQALRQMYWQRLNVLQQDELVQCCVRLHIREMLEPTGLRQYEIDTQIRPSHQALWELICRHLGLADVDTGIQRLTLTLIGMTLHYIAMQDVTQSVCPQVLQQPQALEQLVEELSRFGLAMVREVAQQRGLPLDEQASLPAWTVATPPDWVLELEPSDA